MAFGAGQLVLQADTQSDFAECELVSGTLRWARFQVHQVLRAAVFVPVSQVCARQIIVKVESTLYSSLVLLELHV